MSNLSLNGFTNHSDLERQAEDYYATDPIAIDLLLKQEHFDDLIWECACGEGHLSKQLEKHGHQVYSTDLVDRGYGKGGVDFLKCESMFGGDIITNPPYKHLNEWIINGLALTNRKLALLCRIQTLEGVQRYNKIFKNYPPSRIYVFVKRLHICRNADFSLARGAVCYAWLFGISCMMVNLL